MNKKINLITIKKMYDESPDTSCIGEYTDEIDDDIICRASGKYYKDMDEEERDSTPVYHREYNSFRPYAGGEKPGTADYYKYGLQDFDTMEKLESGSLCFYGIRAEAEIEIEGIINTITSGGLWNVLLGGDQKADRAYVKDIANEEHAQLKAELEALGFTDIPALSDDMIDEIL